MGTKPVRVRTVCEAGVSCVVEARSVVRPYSSAAGAQKPADGGCGQAAAGGLLGDAVAEFGGTVHDVDQVEAAQDLALAAGIRVHQYVEVAGSRGLFGEQGGVAGGAAAVPISSAPSTTAVGGPAVRMPRVRVLSIARPRGSARPYRRGGRSGRGRRLLPCLGRNDGADGVPGGHGASEKIIRRDLTARDIPAPGPLRRRGQRRKEARIAYR